MNFFKGDRAMVKLSDADWQPATVLAREVTGHGTPARQISYYVSVGSITATVSSSQIKEQVR
jgi:hypothetical protein